MESYYDTVKCSSADYIISWKALFILLMILFSITFEEYSPVHHTTYSKSHWDNLKIGIIMIEKQEKHSRHTIYSKKHVHDKKQNFQHVG